jgi:hypothetical protein
MMHCNIMQSIKVVVQKAKYLAINCDEISTITINFGVLCMCILLMALGGC